MDTKAKFQIQIQKVSDKRWFIFQPITGQVLHSIALWLVERFSGLMFWIWISYLNFALLHHRQYVHLLDKAYTAQPEVAVSAWDLWASAGGKTDRQICWLVSFVGKMPDQSRKNMGSVCTMRLIVVVKKTKSSTMLNEVRQSYSTCNLKAILVRNMRNWSRFSLMSSKGKTVEVPFIAPKYIQAYSYISNKWGDLLIVFFCFFPTLLAWLFFYLHTLEFRIDNGSE